MKTCSKCKETKPVAEFSKDARKKDGLRSNCKSCAAIACDKWYIANIEKERVRRAANSEKRNAYFAAYRAANREKCKASSAACRAANPERVKATSAAYRAANPEKVAAANAKWRAANLDRVMAVNSQWSAANPDARRTHKHNRRARKLAAGGKVSKGLFDKLFKLQRGKCPVCKTALSNAKPRSPMDHVIALANGGVNEDHNIQILCQSCNSQKHAKDPIEFMQSRGFLL